MRCIKYFLALELGKIEIKRNKKLSKILNPYENIIDGVNKGRFGLKRKYVRC